MTARSRMFGAIVFSIAVAVSTGPALASPPSYFPSYLLVRPGVTAGHPRHVHGASPGYGIPLTAPSYSYGWFGAQPKRHGTVHHGYYGNHTEWSRR